jgi:ABC-type nitrate/sulfonate/bicarbonate transport system permease component
MSNSALERKFNKKALSNLMSVQTLRDIINKFKPFAILLALWESILLFQVVDPNTLPHTFEVGQTLFELVTSGAVYAPLTTSLYRMGLAFLLAAVVGIPVGLVMGRFRPARWFIDPIISVAFPTPKIVILPMFLIWFGLGSTPVLLIAAIGAVLPIIITTS